MCGLLSSERCLALWPTWRFLGFRPAPVRVVHTTSELLGIQLGFRAALQAGARALLIAHPVSRGIPEIAEHAIHFLQTLAAGLAIVLMVFVLLYG